MSDSVEVSIDTMTSCDIDKAMNLWTEQFTHFCADKALYSAWKSNMDAIATYIGGKAKSGNTVIAKSGNRVVGFIAFDVFSFMVRKALSATSVETLQP